MTATVPIIVPLRTEERSLRRIGGKARSLAELAWADLPVPGGFIIAADAYMRFVDANALALPPSGDVSVEEIAQTFCGGLFDADLKREIREAYAPLGETVAVAVRSSASAEDLPDLSFAGQHESFLNVRGEDGLLDAVRRCWASLWSARAIAYRQEMGIGDESPVMAVIVQEMIEPAVSGVLFTANPATGSRSDLIVNASYGLGDAVVSGNVDPDTYVVDRQSLALRKTSIGSKAHATVSTDDGVEMQPIPAAERQRPSLAAEGLRELCGLGLEVESLFDGVPQDIEWAMDGDRIWLLQARPITGFGAGSELIWEPPAGMKHLLRRQVVENMPSPLSPLFEDLYLREGLDRGMDTFAATMRLPIDLDEFIERPMFVTVNGYGYCRYDMRLSWRLLRLLPKLLLWSVRNLRPFMRNIVPLWQQEGLPRYIQTIDQWRQLDAANASDEQLLDGIRTLALADAGYWFYITMIVGAAKMTEGMFSALLSTPLVRGQMTSGMFLGGFDSKTMQAQTALASVAQKIGATKSSLSADELGAWIEKAPEADSIRTDLQGYLDTYGHQIYDLDFVEPTQGEDKRGVLLGLKSSAGKEGALQALTERRSQLAQERDALTARTLEALGPVRRWLFRRLHGAAQKYGPFREQALFYMGAAWPTLRRLAFEVGARLARAGTLNGAEDVFYLEHAELVTACAARKDRACPSLREAATLRRALRGARMRVHPPGRVPPDMRLKFGPFDFTALLKRMETQKRNAAHDDALLGFAVSPGRVTGIACVVRSGADFADLSEGAILVCPTTTPAWTPLFARAAGLVTDVGGILAHGSIIAREYGIPAVLGTGTATQRIVSGQRITVDGNTGVVTILNERP